MLMTLRSKDDGSVLRISPHAVLWFTANKGGGTLVQLKAQAFVVTEEPEAVAIVMKEAAKAFLALSYDVVAQAEITRE